MDELRRNDTLRLKLSDTEFIDGEVVDYSPDRVMVLVSPNSIENAKKIKELDKLNVFASTHLGIKEMISHVISPLNSIYCITIENTPTLPVVQKRAFVRVASDLKFKILKGDIFYDCTCINISAGGIAFFLKNDNLSTGDFVTVYFPKEHFEKDIIVSAEIIKKNDDWHVAKYFDINSHDEDKIVKYVFKQIIKFR